MTEYLVIYEQGERDWGAYAPDIPGCVSVGKTRAEVEKGIGEAIPMHIELLCESGQPVPKPHHMAGSVAA